MWGFVPGPCRTSGNGRADRTRRQDTSSKNISRQRKLLGRFPRDDGNPPRDCGNTISLPHCAPQSSGPVSPRAQQDCLKQGRTFSHWTKTSGGSARCKNKMLPRLVPLPEPWFLPLPSRISDRFSYFPCCRREPGIGFPITVALSQPKSVPRFGKAHPEIIAKEGIIMPALEAAF